MDNIVEEKLVWFNTWSLNEVSDTMDFIEVIKETELLPSVRMCYDSNFTYSNSVEMSFRYFPV